MIKKITIDNIAEISKIHKNILPGSFFAILGEEFLREFYYKNIIKNKKFSGFYYEFNKKTVGFITFTYSGGIYFDMMKKHFLSLPYYTIKELIRNIKKTGVIISAAYYLLFNQRNELPNIPAEIIAFGVLPDYRANRFNNATGRVEKTDFYRKYRVKVSEELFVAAAKDLYKNGEDEMKITTEKSNTASNKFYSQHGCRPTGIKSKFLDSELAIYRCQIKNILNKQQN